MGESWGDMILTDGGVGQGAHSVSRKAMDEIVAVVRLKNTIHDVSM